ncbi:MAG: aspartate kinase [Deltaproteobacteria bacterium]|nr:aspartate kinase [Deltaproteobacteria bacterium]
MGLLVQKFGGTSVGTVERIHAVASRCANARAAGHDVVVIVSAMAGETNRLLALGQQMASRPDPRELDALAATGEQVTAALLALALSGKGLRARSFLGHQVKILTDSAFSKARIKAVEADRIYRALADGAVAVVAGFQGVDDAGNITTLGRGGSDTSAVAIAAAIGAEVCEIYTDVEGVFTADPGICPSARKVDKISYEEMLELASLGAKVLQIRSVEVAMKYAVPVHVRSSFSDATGTLVTAEDRDLESVVVSGVTYDRNAAKITLANVPDTPGTAARIFEALADSSISVDMIIQNIATDGHTDLTFTISKADAAHSQEIVTRLAEDIGATGVRLDLDVVKVSIVGLGMRSHAGIAARMFRILATEGINIQAISTSEIKVSCLVASKYTELAVRALHEAFGLGKPTEES